MEQIPAPPRKDARTRLLDAALGVIRRQGFAATSVEDLCKAAGVTKGAFFHHFRSKDDLGVAAAAHFGVMAEALFEADWIRLPGPTERVLGYVALRREIIEGGFEDFTCLLGTLVQETYASSPSLRAACEAGILGHARRLVPDLAAALRQAGRTGVDPEGLALHIQAAIQGGFILAKASGDPETARATIDHLARYLRLLFHREDLPMAYVDGFVAAVPTANKEKYLQHATEAAAVFKEYGALEVVECWGDDVPEGETTSFTLAVKREEDETAVFAWISWPSKTARDEAWARIMADPRMAPDRAPMPFDGKRMIYGGFARILAA